MKRVEILGYSAFAVLAVAGIILSIRREGRERQRIARYSLQRGATIVEPDPAGVTALLEEMTPGMRWTPNPVTLMSAPPQSVYFFAYRASTTGRSSPSYGFASLAERAGAQPAQPVSIDPRIPILEKLVENRVEAGGEEFRRAYTVSCRDAEAARTAVNPAVERILLDHAMTAQWGISVTIARRGLLVQSTAAKTETDWDSLIDMAKRLRAVVQ